ncbi:hypothetical protein [Borreliella mayonii]|nr:hypothetical protein [Borreliella mayonii]
MKIARQDKKLLVELLKVSYLARIDLYNRFILIISFINSKPIAIYSSS